MYKNPDGLYLKFKENSLNNLAFNLLFKKILFKFEPAQV